MLNQAGGEGVVTKMQVLHVPYTYFPDASGGTEVYVRGLAQRLCARGYSSAIAAPGAAKASYEESGLSIYRFLTDARTRIDLAYGVPDEIAAEGFRIVVAQARPDIVHLHARTAAISERLIDIGHAAGARVVFTYHTPTASLRSRHNDAIRPKALRRYSRDEAMSGLHFCCARYSEAACARGSRCSELDLHANGTEHGIVETTVSVEYTASDRVWASAFSRFYWQGRSRRRCLAMGERCAQAKRGVRRKGYIVSSGHRRICTSAAADGAVSASRTAEVAYFGRIDAAKGPDLLARALKIIPNALVQFDIFAIRQAVGPDPVYDYLAAQARQDPRLTLRSAVSPNEVIGVMANYDLIAVPSRCLETGPLVALEAFAAGVPVLGANLGGIAELVRDGVDGVLVAADDPAAWAAAIERLVEDRRAIDAMRARVEPPRTMNAVADDMATLYAKVLARS